MRHYKWKNRTKTNKLITSLRPLCALHYVCMCICAAATYNFQSSSSILAYHADMIRISLRKTARALICAYKRKKGRKTMRKEETMRESAAVLFVRRRILTGELLGHVEQTFIVVQP